MAEFRINERQLDQAKASTATTNVVASPVAPMLRTNTNSMASQLATALGAGGELLKQGVDFMDNRDAEAAKVEQTRAKLAALNAEVPTNQEEAQAAIPEENGVAFQRQYMYEMGKRNANDYSNGLTERINTLDPAENVEDAVKSFTNDYTKGLNDKDYLSGFNDIAFRTQEQAISNVKAKRLAELKVNAMENIMAGVSRSLDTEPSLLPSTWMVDAQKQAIQAGVSPLLVEAEGFKAWSATAIKQGRPDLLTNPAWTESKGDIAPFKDRNRADYENAVFTANKALAERNKSSVSIEAYNFTNTVNRAISMASEGTEPLAIDELNPRIFSYIATGVMTQNEGEAMMGKLIVANQKYESYTRLSENLFTGQRFGKSVSAEDLKGVTKLAKQRLLDNGVSPENAPSVLRQMVTGQGRMVPEELDVITRGVNTVPKDGKPSQYTVDAFNMFVEYRNSEHDNLLHSNLSTSEYSFMDKALTLYNQDPSKNAQAAISTAADIVMGEKNPNLEAAYQAIKWEDAYSSAWSTIKDKGGKNEDGTKEYLTSYLRSNGKQLFIGFNGQISSKELGVKLAEKFSATHIQTPTQWIDSTGIPTAKKDFEGKGAEIDASLRWQFKSYLDNPTWNNGKDPKDVKIVLRAAPSSIYKGTGGGYEALIDGRATGVTVDPLQVLNKHAYSKTPTGLMEYFTPIEAAVLAGNYDKTKAAEYRKGIELVANAGVISSKRRDDLLDMNDDNDKTTQKGVFTQNMQQVNARVQGTPLYKNMMMPVDKLQASATSTAPYTFDSKRMPLKMVREQAATFGRKNELTLAAAAAGLGYSGVPYDFGDTKRIGFGYNLTDKEGFIKDWQSAGFAKNDKAAEAAYNGFSSGKLSLDKERATSLHQMFQKRVATQGSTNTAYPIADGIKELQAKNVDSTTWGKRPDGTDKGAGFLGVLQRPDGGVMSEYSIGMNINGKEMDVPSLVPTLTKTEVVQILSLKEGEQVSSTITKKAAEFARKRIKEGKSVFAQKDEGSTSPFKDAPPHLQHAAAFAYMSLKNPSEANAKTFFALVAKGDEEGAKAMFGGEKTTTVTSNLGGVNVKNNTSSRDRLYELFRTMSYNPTVFQRKLESEWSNFK